MASVSKMDRNRLLAERDALVAEIEAKKHELAGMERAIRILEMEGDGGERGAGRRRKSIKNIVLSLLEQHSANGLTAIEVVELAGQRNEHLDRGTVSSLLSRLKRDGVLSLDGSKYKPANSPPATPDGGAEGGPAKLRAVV